MIKNFKISVPLDELSIYEVELLNRLLGAEFEINDGQIVGYGLKEKEHDN